MSTRIQSITFWHYKAFENYSIAIDHVNILTGLNNSGKSTVLGSLRVLAVALRTARKSKPERIALVDSHCIGYRIKESQVPISLENVATNYVDGTSKISFELTNGNSLHLIFDGDAGCVLVPESQNGSTSTPRDFRSQFPIGLTVIPVLGPVEHRESLREVETVTSSLSTHRASRHFRNYWYHFPDGFDGFAQLIESTWAGMKIQRPEINGGSDLSMFVTEDRIDRELYWVGFGFQIWCQLLTHLHRADPTTMIVIDEPEVYLHPEIQRKLLQVLKSTGADILVATHSIEIIAEAELHEVLIIDKRKTSAIRQSNTVKGHSRRGKDIETQSTITRSVEPPSTSHVSMAHREQSGFGKRVNPSGGNTQALKGSLLENMERMDEPSLEVLNVPDVSERSPAKAPESSESIFKKKDISDVGNMKGKAKSLIAYLNIMDGAIDQGCVPEKDANSPPTLSSASATVTRTAKKTPTTNNNQLFDLSEIIAKLDKLGFAFDDVLGRSLIGRMAQVLDGGESSSGTTPSTVSDECPALENSVPAFDSEEVGGRGDALPSKVIYGTRSPETCLLIPALLERAINVKFFSLFGDSRKSMKPSVPVAGVLMQISHAMKPSCELQFRERVEHHLDVIGCKNINDKHQVDRIFDNLWKVTKERMKFVHGKAVLRIFCEQILMHLDIEISHNDILDAIEPHEIPVEIRDLILERRSGQLSRFRDSESVEKLDSRIVTQTRKSLARKSDGVALDDSRNIGSDERSRNSTRTINGLNALLDSEQLEWEPDQGQGSVLNDDAIRVDSATLYQTVSDHDPIDSSQDWDAADFELPELGEPLFQAVSFQPRWSQGQSTTEYELGGAPQDSHKDRSQIRSGSFLIARKSSIVEKPTLHAGNSDFSLEVFPGSSEFEINDKLLQRTPLGDHLNNESSEIQGEEPYRSEMTDGEFRHICHLCEVRGIDIEDNRAKGGALWLLVPVRRKVRREFETVLRKSGFRYAAGRGFWRKDKAD